MLPHVDQTNESDLGFLNRVAQSAGFLVKPCAGKVLLDRRFSGRTVSGKVLEARDLKSGGIREFIMGDGEPELRLPHVYAGRQAAKQGAEAKLRNVNSIKGMQVDVNMPGDATLFSGLPILLKGFRQGVDGNYFIQRIVHRVNRSGFVTSFTAYEKYSEGEEEKAASQRKQSGKGDGFEAEWDNED